MIRTEGDGRVNGYGNGLLSQDQWLSVQRRLGISPRQAELIRWMLEGKSPEQIAAAMHIKVRTVTTHRERLYKTLNVHNGLGLAGKVIEALKPMLKDER